MPPSKDMPQTERESLQKEHESLQKEQRGRQYSSLEEINL